MQKLGDAFLHNLLESFTELEAALHELENATRTGVKYGPEAERVERRRQKLEAQFQSLGPLAQFVASSARPGTGWQPNRALIDQLQKLLESVAGILARLAPRDIPNLDKKSLAGEAKKFFDAKHKLGVAVKSIGVPSGPAISKPAAAEFADPVAGLVITAAFLVDLVPRLLKKLRGDRSSSS